MRNKDKLIKMIILFIGIAMILGFSLFDWNSINSYNRYNSDTTHYVKARVLKVISENLVSDEIDSKRLVGEQELEAEILDDWHKGEVIQLTNYLTQVHNIYVKAGSNIIICADAPLNAEPYYTVYNYDRTSPLIFIMVVFCACVLLVGRKKGISTLLGVGFTILVIFTFSVNAIYHGYSPTLVAIITVLVSTGFSLGMLNGVSKKTIIAVVSTVLGVMAVGIVFALFTSLLNLSGFNMESAESLILVQQSTGLRIKGLLLACTLIAALGAVMDVAVSLTAALEEMVMLDSRIDAKKLFESGLNVGKDMIATMSNTLILAFVGTSLPTILCLVSFGYSTVQFISSDFLAVEVVQGICATIGVILTVPITSFVASMLLTHDTSFSHNVKMKNNEKER